MKLKTFSIFGAIMLMIAMGGAQAALVVDTGAGTTSGGNSLDGTDWLAGKVTFADALTITSVSGWLKDLEGAGNSFTIALYSDAANLPGNLLQSATATISTVAGVAGWNGASGLNWSVNAGSYWVAFEVGGNDNLSMGVAPLNAPQPLSAYAFNDGGISGYQTTSSSFGVQVAAVPEPESYALMLAGLGLIGATMRRRSLAA